MLVTTVHEKFQVKFFKAGISGKDTVCEIKPFDSERCTNFGAAYLHHLDKNKYDRFTGKKLALTRALSGFDKEERSIFWECFFNEFGHLLKR